MFRLVKCPICSKTVKTKGKYFFRHCGMAFKIKKCLTPSNETIFHKRSRTIIVKKPKRVMIVKKEPEMIRIVD